MVNTYNTMCNEYPDAIQTKEWNQRCEQSKKENIAAIKAETLIEMNLVARA